jgi:putative endonuclease
MAPAPDPAEKPTGKSGRGRGNKDLGDAGEAIAGRELLRLGFKIVETNYRVRAGEVDIIALDGDEYVFVEVKTRLGLQFGGPEEAITARKKARMIDVAQAYLEDISKPNADWRIDVVTINRPTQVGPLRPTLLRNAVSQDDAGSS